MENVKVAAANVHVEFNKEENQRKIFDLIERASREKADLLVLPELVLNGYLWGMQGVGELSLKPEQQRYFMETAEPIPGPTTEKIQSYAAKYQMDIVVGMAEKSGIGGGAILHNSAYFASSAGNGSTFRKIHLPADEVHLFNPGNSLPVFDSKIGKIGIQICWDIAFPEVSRILALRGAQVLCFPTIWPMQGEGSGEDAWAQCYDVWTRARAMENQVWLVASNQVGFCPKSHWRYYGHSRVVAPNGRLVKELKGDEGLLTEEIDVADGIMSARTTFIGGSNTIKDRRPDVYKPIIET